MKSFLSAAFILSVLTMSVSSCSKCYVCDFDGDVREVCSKDLKNGNRPFKLTIEAYEQQGYKCTAK